MDREIILFVLGAVAALSGGLVVSLAQRWSTSRSGGARPVRERQSEWRRKVPNGFAALSVVGRIVLLLLMLTLNPLMVFGRELATVTRTGLYYVVLQIAWYVVLVAVFGDWGCVLVGLGVGLHLSAALFEWGIYYRDG
jgi:hypothetical protein